MLSFFLSLSNQITHPSTKDTHTSFGLSIIQNEQRSTLPPCCTCCHFTRNEHWPVEKAVLLILITYPCVRQWSFLTRPFVCWYTFVFFLLDVSSLLLLKVEGKSKLAHKPLCSTIMYLHRTVFFIKKKYYRLVTYWRTHFKCRNRIGRLVNKRSGKLLTSHEGRLRQGSLYTKDFFHSICKIFRFLPPPAGILMFS